jgi:multidrug efflux system membrane fusion protein
MAELRVESPPDVLETPRPVALPAERRRRWPAVAVLAVLLAVGVYWLRGRTVESAPAGMVPAGPAARAVPVVAATAHSGDMPVYLAALGSVTAFNTVTVRSRVDGELVHVAFREGQFVHEGDLLAEIDPRPFQVQLAQAEGQMARDVAQLKAAKANLERYRDLAARDFIARQQVDDQAAQVGQYEGAIKIDQAAIDNARLQLVYCRITAPISGRVGLRLVDVGNIVHANDQTGLVVITQVQPIAVVFTITEDELQPVIAKLHADETLLTEAFDRSGEKRLATGSLLTADNQIDQSTGTTRLKAVFPNSDNALFPNQFVNVRLLLDRVHDAVIVPQSAIQRGPQGTYLYTVKPDQTVEVRPVNVGPTNGGEAAVTSGLAAGEVVVIDGIDKLRPGVAVQLTRPADAAGGEATQRPPA